MGGAEHARAIMVGRDRLDRGSVRADQNLNETEIKRADDRAPLTERLPDKKRSKPLLHLRTP
jgi:hypothetical protein